MLANSLVKGWVRHKRYTPKVHEFDYDMDWTLLDLDTVEELFLQSKLWSVEKANIVSYRVKDFHYGLELPEEQSLEDMRARGALANKKAITKSIREKLGKSFSGKVFMMSHLRNYGYNFNSVCFYFCYEDSDLKYIVSEITNTPWGERHSYIFDCTDSRRQAKDIHQFEFDKEFHVSPFIKMNMKYRWTFRITPDDLRVHMSVLDTKNKKYFDATFTGDLLPLSCKVMNRFAWKHAFQPIKMSLTIYWQALKLWLKRVTVHDHPKHSNHRSR
jgi:hypothetical protein